MKNITRSFAVFAAIATAGYAAPFLAIDDNAEVFLTGTVGVKADSNIFLAQEQIGRDLDDVVFDFTPGVQLVFGKTSAIQGTWSLAESFTNYVEHDDLNDNLFSSALNTTYDDGKSKFSFNASFNELNQNTVDTRGTTIADGLIRRDVFATGARGEVSVTEKSSVAIGLQYQKSEFERVGFSDSQVLTIPVNYYYELTPKVDMSFGYRFRQRWESINLDSKDHFVSVGARGEFTPKLTGEFSVGVTQREFSAPRRAPVGAFKFDDETLLDLDASLLYQATAKTSVQIGLSNDFDTNSQGQQQKNFAFRVTAASRLSEEWTLTTGVAYRAIDYYANTPARIDDYLEGQVGMTYTINAHVTVTAAIALRSNDSDVASSDFDSEVFSVAANFRF